MEEKTLNTITDNDKAEGIYRDACLLMKSSDINLLRSAIEYFDSIPCYRDSADKKNECLEKIEKIFVRMEKDRKYMKLNIAIICAAMITILALLTVFIITLVTREDNNNYQIDGYDVREFTQKDPIPSDTVVSEDNTVINE